VPVAPDRDRSASRSDNWISSPMPHLYRQLGRRTFVALDVSLTTPLAIRSFFRFNAWVARIAST
jgi:hypothetical protein